MVVYVICWMLLALNFSFVAIAMVRWSMQHALGGFGVSVVAALYIAFVVYLLLGPSRVYDMLSTSNSPALEFGAAAAWQMVW